MTTAVNLMLADPRVYHEWFRWHVDPTEDGKINAIRAQMFLSKAFSNTSLLFMLLIAYWPNHSAQEYDIHYCKPFSHASDFIQQHLVSR